MTSRLHGFSFHSVKGGVGKSTLSTLTAIALAHAHPHAAIYLVDMDLTGTSLADVLPLKAPRWDGIGPDETIDVMKEPSGYCTRAESRARLRRRGEPASPDGAGVPFLNDYLLFEPKNWGEDVKPRHIAWKMENAPENVHVFPSSALPRDLSRALPVIYDEEHAAFLEARLEHFLSAIIDTAEEPYVVFDTPPTIPGLSRSVLNLAFRMSRERKTPLARDGIIPPLLCEATVQWRAFVVATQDCQDARAAERWLDLVRPDDQHIVQFVINRARGDQQQRVEALQRHLRDFDEEPKKRFGEKFDIDDVDPMTSLNPLVSGWVWIEENTIMQDIFRQEKAPRPMQKLLEELGIESSLDGGFV